MTRDFNNQRREDPHSDSRDSSSRRFEDERPSRPARPRLNRDTVDRAWKNGARQNHADYHTRSDNKTHSTRDNRRPNQRSNQYSAQTSNNGRNPYGNRQDKYRPGEHSPRSSNGSRPRKFESNMRRVNEQHSDQYERRGYSNQSYQDDFQPGNSRNPQRPYTRTQYHQGREQYEGSQRREFDRGASSHRNFDRDQRQARSYEHDTRKPRSYDRDKRFSRNSSGSDTKNPRWQSHTERRKHKYSNRSHEYTRYDAEQELFEGDYEHFDRSNAAQTHTHASHRPEERNVTRLPDDRVLKGTPHEQHRNAEFWTEIAQESDELLKQVEPSHTQEAASKQPDALPTDASTKRKANFGTLKASKSTRERKTSKAKVKQNTPKQRSTGPRPSQRGFKWPTPEE